MSDAPRLLVLGANGRLGQCVIADALERGACVTAFVRPGRGLPPRLGLSVATGEIATDRAAIAAVMPGHDAVISALGNPLWLKGLHGPAIVEAAFANTISAMRTAGVRRIVAPLAWGSGASLKPSGLLVRLIAATLIRRDYRDFSQAEERLVESDLDWTIAYFGALTAEPATSNWKASTTLRTPNALAIARADVARFLVEAALTGKHVHERVVLSGGRAR